MTTFHTPTLTIPPGPWTLEKQALLLMPKSYISCNAEDFYRQALGNNAPSGVEGTVTYIPHNERCLAQITSCRFHEKVITKVLAKTGWVGIQFALRGQYDSVIDGYGQLSYSGTRLTVAANAQPVRVANCYQAECNFDYVSFLVRPEFLVDQIGVEPEQLPETIQAILSGTESAYFNQSLPMTPNMMSALEDLTSSHYSGKLQETFARIKTMELLFLAVQALITSSNSTQTKVILGDYHIDLLHQARDILDDDFATPPTLAELGRQVGMNRNKLSQGFKVLFGSGVYEYCQQLRMQQAILLLRENRLSLLQIAERIGYKNQSSFTRAYKNFYGHVPSLE